MALGRTIKYSNEARQAIFQGIEELANAVITTLGPKGKTVIIDNGTTHPVITKDGVTVARAISFTDKWKNIGASLIKEAANRTNQIAGDGTTTATLLTYELIKTGMNLANMGFDRLDIKLGYQKALKDVSELLKEYVVKINTIDDILHIATISANNDTEIGETIKEAFENIGDDGIISIMDSYATSGKTVVRFSSGFEFDKGYTSSLFINNKDDSFEAENPKILLFNNKLDDSKDVMPILNIASKQDLELVIIAPEYSQEFHGLICKNVEDKNLKCCLVRAPGFTKTAVTERLEDLCVLLDCKVWDNGTIDCFNPSIDFGSCDTIKVSNTKTQISKEKINDAAVQERCEQIRKELSKNDDVETALTEIEIQSLKERLAKLTGGVATIYIGAHSAIEMKEKKDRYEDAVNAVRAAISDGIISGGGSALAKAATRLLEDEHNLMSRSKTDEVAKAYKAFLEVCLLPAEIIIASNDTRKAQLILSNIVTDEENIHSGYNAKLGYINKDLIKAGIVDPVKVVQTALIYATSIATVVLTSDCVITSDSNNINASPNDVIMDSTYDDM